MVTFDSLLAQLYQIQGLSDPNDSAATMKERLDRIFEIASEAMEDSGYQPPKAPKSAPTAASTSTRRISRAATACATTRAVRKAAATCAATRSTG